MGISELLHGFAQCQAEHAINGGQHLGLTLLNSRRLLLVGHHLAQLQAKFTQLGTYHTRHTTGIVGAVSLWLQTFGYQAVLARQVGNTAEGSAIVDGMMEEELHAQVINGFVSTVDEPLQHQVGLLQLVVEEQIVVRELHSKRVLMLLGEVGTKHVQPREHPATSTRLLVVNALLGCLDAEVGINVALIGEILGQIVNRVLRNGVEKGFLRGVGSLCLLHLRKHLGRYSTIVFLCRNRQRSHQAQR